MARYSIEIRDKFNSLVEWAESDMLVKLFVMARATKHQDIRIFDTQSGDEFRLSDDKTELIEV